MIFNRKNLKFYDLRRKSKNIYKRNYFIISFVLLIILDGSLEYEVHVWPVIVYIDCSNKNWTFFYRHVFLHACATGSWLPSY